MSKKKRIRNLWFALCQNQAQTFFEIIGVSLWVPSSLNFNPLDYTIWADLENKTNATSYPNIGLHKTAIEEEWNKMSEEFILKVC